MEGLTMANEKKAGIFNASARDGVQYRKASMLEMILGNANNGCGMHLTLQMQDTQSYRQLQVSLLQEQDFLMDSQMRFLQHCSKK